MEKKYYIAYGSNLSAEQMKARTPDARIVGVIRRIIRSCNRLIKWSRFDTVSFVPAFLVELLMQNKLRHTRVPCMAQ